MKTRVVCLLTACVVLVSAITVSAVNGSPYEQLKNAMLDVLFYDNYTVEYELTFRLNGAVEESRKIFYSQGDNAALHVTSEWLTDLPLWLDTINPNGEYVETSVSYDTQDFHLGRSRWTSRNNYNLVYSHNPDNMYHQNFHFNRRLADDMFYGNIERDSNSIRFTELLADLFIGDLRNNISTSTQNGVRYFTGEITGVQIPEMLRLIADIAVEDGHMWLTDDILAKGISINRIRGDAQVDSNGNLIYLAAHINLIVTDEQGFAHNADLDMLFSFYDIGTSNPQIPVQGVKELFTLDYILENFTVPEWSRNYRLTFTLDEYGNIDMDSIR